MKVTKRKSLKKRAERLKKMQQNVNQKSQRKIKAQKSEKNGIWFGLGMFGIVGWAVAIPTLIGIAVGIWIDTNWSTPYSWTLMMLLIGVILGCINAWYWVHRESEEEE